MATATVEMVVHINVDVDVDDSITYSQFYECAVENAKGVVKRCANLGMGMNIAAISGVQNVVASKYDPRPRYVDRREVVDNTK